MREKERVSPPMVGGSSLLVIFAVLCLTCFALLSLSTVRANGRLGDAAARAVSEYYQADCQAESILARLRNGELPVEVESHGYDSWHRGTRYTYTVPISDTQALEVAVLVEGSGYTVLRWQAVSTADWAPDDSLEVWGGESLS